jgi:hypothetical protein
VFAADVAVRLKPHPVKEARSFYAARKAWLQGQVHRSFAMLRMTA